MENEGEMYHAAATVSTLLLKLGEVTRKFQSSKEAQTNESSADEWFITFEQLIASLLTDNLLVKYFDQKFDITNRLNEYKSQHAWYINRLVYKNLFFDFV